MQVVKQETRDVTVGQKILDELKSSGKEALHIRNERESVELEIILDGGKYSDEVSTDTE
jgi:hypothetical protein